MSERAITHVVVDPHDAGERADVVLARRVPELSRRAARALALAGRLRIDDHPAPPSTRVALGQTLRLALGPEIEAPPGEPRIVAVTERFVYVDKPTGWHTHRLRPDDPPTLADAIARAHPECAHASEEPREGGAIHRLDRETTGLVVFARTLTAWAEGRSAMARTSTVKLYVALGRGAAPLAWPPAVAHVRPTAPPAEWPSSIERPSAVEAWSITAPLGRGADRTRVSVRADGVAAHTIVVPIAAGLTDDAIAPARIAFVVRLHTGHRHQARVHLAHIGWPIVGDARYDLRERSEPSPEGRAESPLLLHCARIDLSASCPGEPSVEAALPSHVVSAFGEAALVPWAGPGAP
jgi:23S rRNA pseudouridine1911/1915/1917 synthase